MIPIRPGVEKALNALRPRDADPSDVICPHPVRYVNRRFTRDAKAAGLEGLTPHALRHSFITNMLDAQVPVHTTAALAGHSRPAVTLDTYSHLVSDEARAAMAAMDARKPKAQQHQIELDSLR